MDDDGQIYQTTVFCRTAIYFKSRRSVTTGLIYLYVSCRIINIIFEKNSSFHLK